MSHQHAGTSVEHSGSPFHWVNGHGLQMRLQAFLTVRNAADEVALVQLEKPPGHWWLPAETLQPNEPVLEAGQRVAKTWFGEDLGQELATVVNFAGDEETGEPWYHCFIFEARAELEDLQVLDDTVGIEFTAPGDSPPGPFAMGHEDLWPEISASALRL